MSSSLTRHQRVVGLSTTDREVLTVSDFGGDTVLGHDDLNIEARTSERAGQLMAANGKPLVLPEEASSPTGVTVALWLESVAQVVAAILARRTDQSAGTPNGASVVECATMKMVTDDASR
jgi:hypothetical protein